VMMIPIWRNSQSQAVQWHSMRRKVTTSFLGSPTLCANPGSSGSRVGGAIHDKHSASFGTVFFYQRVFFSELAKSQALQRRDRIQVTATTTTSSSSSSSRSSIVGVSKERKLTTKFLDQVNHQRIAPEVVTQKVEEHLLLMLADYEGDSGHPQIVSDDFSIALNLLNVALQYHDEFPSGDIVIIPKLFSLACQVMVRSDNPNSVDEVYRQIGRLLDCHKRYFRLKDLAFNTHYVNDACCTFITRVALESIRKNRKLDHQRSLQINSLLRRMEQLYDNLSIALVANSVAFEAYILFLCSQRKPREAYNILQGMVERSWNHPVKLIPLVLTFTNIINCFAMTHEPEKALSVIQWMLACQKEGTESPLSIVPPPNKICFNALLHAYAMAGGKDSGRKAEQTMEWMQRLHETEKLNTKPDRNSFNTCINAWAQSRHPDSPMHAEALLRRLLALHSAGLEEMPSSETFTSVMNAWANSSTTTAVKQVEAILDHMERVSETTGQLTMTPVAYTVYIKALGKASQQCRGNESLNCANMALQVQDRMNAKGVSITAQTYSGLLTAIMASSALNASFYFLELEQQYREGLIQLDTTAFNCGLSAIAALNRPDGVDRAASLLKRMFEYSLLDESVQPNSYTYNIILKVLSRSSASDAPDKAEALLQEMDEMPNVVPNFISYLTCIIAWGRSDRDEKFNKVTDLVHGFVTKLEEEGGLSEASNAVVVFNAGLSACLHNVAPELSNQALNTACTTMSTLRQTKGLQPNQEIYSSWFRAIAVCVNGDSPPEIVQSQIINEFGRCVNDGLVTQDVINAVQKTAPHLFEEVARKNKSKWTDCIPESWSKNVKISRKFSYGDDVIG
jgi:hypothetical protein